MEGKPIVLITGISGYIGSQVCLKFLQNGGFRVRGTVRSATNQAKIQPLIEGFGQELFDQLELVEADLLQPQTLEDAIAGAQYVVHTASPFPIQKPKHENDLIKPAVEGTMTVMRAALKHKVQRVVITSSGAAIYKNKDPKKTHFTTEDWTDLSIASAYEKSKTMAEKCAWDFLATLPEEERFEFATINPGLVLGPNLVKCQFSSGDVVKMLMIKGKRPPAMPHVQVPIVDVRDVAQAHLQAILVPEAKN